MKGTKGLFRLGAIALALSLMVLTGCPDPNGGGNNNNNGGNNNPSDPFAGTWEGAGTLSYFPTTSGAWKIIAADGSFKVYLTDGAAASNLEVAHGPYTYAGSTVILTITQTLEWWSVGNTITNSQWVNSGTTITANIINNTIITGGVTFTKKPVTYTISGTISTIDGGGTVTSAPPFQGLRDCQDYRAAGRYTGNRIIAINVRVNSCSYRIPHIIISLLYFLQ
ncbi:hypothetical protein FACS189442_1360 [Spirochaetia bacterium]|nr:hypothetical protein FACS189442_1360 [Spirochaetia bacterium]